VPVVPEGASWTPAQVDLIRRTVAEKATNDELALFLYQAHRTGLDPLARQIYCVKRGNRATIQTGIDGYRLLAARTGAYAGNDDPEYLGEEEGHPLQATATVWKIVAGQRCPFTATARWSEYRVEGDSGMMWRRMPYLMLGKCAESLALRKAFPAELSGLYTDDEMAQADIVATAVEAPPTVAPQPARLTPTKTAMSRLEAMRDRWSLLWHKATVLLSIPVEELPTVKEPASEADLEVAGKKLSAIIKAHVDQMAEAEGGETGD